MSAKIVLMGNQNSGKSTLFNQLTGSNQHVGNFPGVTVEHKVGGLKKYKDVEVVDLPGIYSLSPYTAEEAVTRDYIFANRPDAIINIVDATSLERNLYLTLQIMELNFPTVIALNMMDDLKANGGSLDVEGLEKALGVPIVPISAMKNQGIDLLCKKVLEVAEQKILPKKMDFCTGPTHKAIHAIAHISEENAKAAELPIRFSATKLVEGDDEIIRRLKMSDKDMKVIEILVEEMEESLETDRDAALADMRYEFIERQCCPYLHHHGENKGHNRSVNIDKILTHRVFAIPIFLAIMAVIFWLTFGLIGPLFNNAMSVAVQWFTDLTNVFLQTIGVHDVVRSLVIDGAFAGVGAILSFLPTIIILFFFLSLLEDSGYMARVAFVFDHTLRKLGLSGRAFVPMLIGFGCSVPAIMATRTLGSERDRKMTIMLIPFMSCSAKLPIYAVFTMAFFPQHSALVMISLYVIGIVVGVLCALLLKRVKFKGESVSFIMELPSYRLPSLKSMSMDLWDKTKDFLTRAFTVIFVASIVVWFLQSFDFTLHTVTNSGDSILAALGKTIAPIFVPLGFGDWQSSTALVTGLLSKETVISTFSILLGAGDSAGLAVALPTMFSTLSAFSFLVFTLLYMPCIAAFAVTRRELGSMARALKTAAFQTTVAWLCAFIVYQIGGFFF
ncbi:MAG: ferrous iron transport protein B [Clostridiales bacterium]